MLICTNKQAVDTVYATHQARDVHEIMREIYPDATFDGQRYHAPYDGYRCEITGTIYRGGEYLPMTDEPSGGSAYTVCATLGSETITWTGTKAQIAAVRAELLTQGRAERRKRDAKSQHVGTIGEKITTKVTVDYISARMGYYGHKFWHSLRDQDGNVIIYSGSKMLTGKIKGLSGPSHQTHIDLDYITGTKLCLSATVAEHSSYEGVKQTIIKRPRIGKTN